MSHISIHYLKKHKSLLVGSILLLIIILIALFPRLFCRYNPIEQNTSQLLLPPSLSHPFGTDNYGRDLFSRVIYGTRVDLMIGFLAMIVPFFTGSIIGILAGYYGGAVDAILMRILDITAAFPFLILVIGIVSILGANISNLYIAIWIVGWCYYARLVRSEVLSEKNVEYVQAAKLCGFSNLRIMMKHIFPNVISSAVVYAISDIMMCMLLGASLSFLGLGVQPPIPEWGAIISEGRPYMTQAWWLTTFPGIALAITGVSISLVGEGLSGLIINRSSNEG